MFRCRRLAVVPGADRIVELAQQGVVYTESSEPSMRIFLLSCLLVLTTTAVHSKELELTFQTHDPATRRILLATEKVDSKFVEVIAVDYGTLNWCNTGMMRLDAIVPRMNKALDAARQLGMTVMLCPS